MMGGVYVKGRIWTGVFILLIGIVALLKAALVPLPYWFFSWPMFLIALGVFIGIRHGFRGISWLILMLIGGAFLADNIYPDIEMRRYTWPAVLIVLGLFFIFRPRRRWHWEIGEKKTSAESDMPTDPLINPGATDSKEDYVNATSVFGGAKKNILSKNFKGGEIVNIFGGTELDLSRADINGEAVIEMTTIFGGTKLIIPSNWTVKSDAAIIFGGIEDKRAMPAVSETSGKTLTLKGTVIFGGIDIKSY
jgi:predicted membrane protein